jgi:hypothetical protein
VLTIGGARGERFRVSPWEFNFRAADAAVNQAPTGPAGARSFCRHSPRLRRAALAGLVAASQVIYASGYLWRSVHR